MARPRRGSIKGPFVPHTLDLLQSASWAERTVPLMRILDRLEVEHLRHAGTRNNRLFVSYGQFVESGISRRAIAPALTLGEELGLLKIVRPSASYGGIIRPPTAYGLTYAPDATGNTTNEWRRVTPAQAKAARRRANAETAKSA
ncbi:MAG: hypothetical protein K5872_22860 [Rhizobiaceae bacterium]|nr:hypothetical protein [Rhizobiaceae bacterium]MCV0409064.1 hypothetical protein [Rhizobiaceae bacterium]